MSRPEGSREQLASRAFVALADTLIDDYDVIDLLDRLVAYSVQLLAADAAGLLLADARGRLRAVASSSDGAQLMELLQLQAEEGPCLDCYRTGEPVSAPDLNEFAGRWPTFVAEARSHGAFASVHALPMRLRGQVIGTLNLLHGAPGSLPADDLALGQALTDIATIGIVHERAVRQGEVLNQQLQTALTSRVIIEQAKGALAQYGGLTMDEAFNRLRGHVRSHNLRLSVVARLLVQGELDPAVITPPVEAPRPRPTR